MEFFLGGSLTSGQLIRAPSRLPQGNAFQLLVLFLSCQNTESEATPFLIGKEYPKGIMQLVNSSKADGTCHFDC